MTNKAEYPSDELIFQWEHDAKFGATDTTDALKRLVAKAIAWALQGAEPVATTLLPDPEDEREGIYFSNADWKRLMALPPHTKLYTSPQAPELPRESIVFALGCLDARIERAGQLVMCMADTVIASHHSAQIHDWLLNSAPPTTLKEE